MDKPKGLSGKVYKFEDIAYLYDDDMENLETRQFYTQPFTSDMIEKYFEDLDFEWETYYEDIDGAEIRYYEDPYSIGDDFVVLFSFTPAPKTLSDFIDACINSEINLVWK